MKIRSILAELEVVDCRAATEFALNQEVVCITAVDLAARASEARVTPLGMRELVLCRPGDFGGPWTPPGTVSLVLYHAAIPDDAVHAGTSCIVAATSLPISKAFERFDRIPQQVVAIDAMKGRLFDTFQHTHNIRQFVQRAYNVLGLPTIVVNTDGRILAHVGEFSDAREDIAAQLKTGYIAPEVQAVIDRDRIVENARAKHYPDASHDVSNDENWVTSVVYYKRLELGRFDVYKPQGAFTGYDLELIDYAGSLAGIIIDRMTDVATNSNQGASVLSDILDGRFTQTKDATGRLADAGVDTSGAYAMLTVEGERLPHVQLACRAPYERRFSPRHLGHPPQHVLYAAPHAAHRRPGVSLLREARGAYARQPPACGAAGQQLAARLCERAVRKHPTVPGWL